MKLGIDKIHVTPRVIIEFIFKILMRIRSKVKFKDEKSTFGRVSLLWRTPILHHEP